MVNTDSTHKQHSLGPNVLYGIVLQAALVGLLPGSAQAKCAMQFGNGGHKAGQGMPHLDKWINGNGLTWTRG